MRRRRGARRPLYPQVLDTTHAGDHTVFIGEVTAGESYDGPSYPLLYDPGEYEEALS
ncbi:MAG: flavin reductase family protein [Actinobacteria bacterium]|nr:flavin reductase family protein [Actinomycetota bacterium]